MSGDPFRIPLAGDPIPRSATLINSMLGAARQSSDADSPAVSSVPFDADHYPFRIIFIRNTTPLQIWHDWPVAIGKPPSLSDSDFINGQPVFPIVSYTSGWSTFARPLKRLPPGCAGPALLLGWLGPHRVITTGVLGASVWRRTQPQRAYGGTAITGVPYVQATAQNYPRSATQWNGVGFKLGFGNFAGLPERVPQMESLKNYLHTDGGVYLNFAHRVDQHGWWCPVIEVRRQQFGALWSGQTYYFPPTDRRFRISAPNYSTIGDDYSGNVDVSFEPILWNPAVVSFNPAYGANNFNSDPIISSSGTFNRNGGLIPQEMICLQTAAVNWSTKGNWNAGLSENFQLCNSPQLYGYGEYIDIDQGTWTPNAYWMQTWRYAAGPEMLQIFETDRDDSTDAQGNVLPPVIGSGPGPVAGGSGTIGLQINGPIVGVHPSYPLRVFSRELLQRIVGGVYGARLGSGSPASASASLSGSGTATGSGIG